MEIYMKAIERLYKYLSLKGISPNKFETGNGLSSGYLSKMYKRNADMGESILVSVLENCPDLRAEWLLTGKGEMLAGSGEEVEIQEGHEVEFYKIMLQEKKNEIADKDKEIARLNKLVGRYEERLSTFPSENESFTTSRGDMSRSNPEGVPRTASELPSLSVPPEVTPGELSKGKQPGARK